MTSQISNPPTRTEVESISIGGTAPDCFGRPGEVVSIHGRGDDINGRAYVCYYTKFCDTARISMSVKEGEKFRSAGR